MSNLEYLKKIKEYDVPTVCNALECFGMPPNTGSVISNRIKEIIPYGSSFIGHACTAKMTAAEPAKRGETSCFEEYYSSVLKIEGPRITVIEDVDPEPTGSFWGEVNCSIHMALGVSAVVTNGGVRDISEAQKLGFGYFASCKLQTHAYNRLVSCNTPVNILGAVILPGEIIYCDQHGVITIPEEVVPMLPEVCRLISLAELPVIDNCKRTVMEGRTVSVAELMGWRKEMADLRAAAKDAASKLIAK